MDETLFNQRLEQLHEFASELIGSEVVVPRRFSSDGNRLVNALRAEISENGPDWFMDLGFEQNALLNQVLPVDSGYFTDKEAYSALRDLAAGMLCDTRLRGILDERNVTIQDVSLWLEQRGSFDNLASEDNHPILDSLSMRWPASLGDKIAQVVGEL